jgi:alpha-tubulin suppressor-like RCC1 family protein
MKISSMGLVLIAGLLACLFAVSMPALAMSPKIIQVAGGEGSNVISLLEDGSVWTWGSNYEGELGIGNNIDSFVPVKVNISNVTHISAGMNYMLAVKDDGTVWGWGMFYDNNLGIIDQESLTTLPGNARGVLTPIQVKGIDGVKKVAAGSGQCYALKNDGTVYNVNKDCYYPTIQLAIDNASGGDTI